MYLRTVKVPSSNGAVNEYVRVVEAYRENGKVKQRVIADLGRKDFLLPLLPQLQRVLLGETAVPGAAATAIDVLDASTWGPVLVVRALFEQLGLWEIFDRLLPPAKKGVSATDRVFVLLANRLVRPPSEHGLARWLETDFVCDRQGRRFVPHWHQHQRVQVHPRQKGQGRYTFLSGTLTGNPVACAAGLAALAVLRQPGVYERLHVAGQRLTDGLRQAGVEAEVPLQVIGDGPVLQVVFTLHQPLRTHRDLLRADKKKALQFGHELIRRGVYCAPGGKLYLSLAHTDADLDRTAEIAGQALRAMR